MHSFSALKQINVLIRSTPQVFIGNSDQYEYTGKFWNMNSHSGKHSKEMSYFIDNIKLDFSKNEEREFIVFITSNLKPTVKMPKSLC